MKGINTHSRGPLTIYFWLLVIVQPSLYDAALRIALRLSVCSMPAPNSTGTLPMSHEFTDQFQPFIVQRQL